MNHCPNAVAIIPARGGRKRIPRKNIRRFRGRPMIAWSIDAAIASGVFDTVMVSTDDAEIAEVSRNLGAEVPFMRSAIAADDHATTADVLLEVLGRYAQDGVCFDLACCLYPTAPFVQPQDLSYGRKLLIESDQHVIMPVAAFSYPIWRSLKREQDGRIDMYFPQNLNTRSQDLPTAFHDAGQWYWFEVDVFKREHVLMGSKTGSIILPLSQVQDIDTEEDWTLAELKHEKMFP